MALYNVQSDPHTYVTPDESAPVFAGHSLKSLTVHTSASGLAEFVTTVGDVVTRITLTPAEKGKLAQALFSVGRPVEITTY